MMKRLLSILSLLLLFVIGQEIMAATGESVTDKKQTTATANEKALSLQHKIKDFELNRSPNAAPCLRNRVQLSTEIGERFLKTAARQFELFLQKEQDALNDTIHPDPLRNLTHISLLLLICFPHISLISSRTHVRLGA